MEIGPRSGLGLELGFTVVFGLRTGIEVQRRFGNAE